MITSYEGHLILRSKEEGRPRRTWKRHKKDMEKAG